MLQAYSVKSSEHPKRGCDNYYFTAKQCYVGLHRCCTTFFLFCTTFRWSVTADLRGKNEVKIFMVSMIVGL